MNTITQMLIGGHWPDDCQGQKIGKPKYIEVAGYVQQKGYEISEHSIGRYSRRLRAFSVMKQSAELVKVAMKARGNEIVYKI